MPRAIATVAMWGGIVCLSYIFHSSGILSSSGAVALACGGLWFTAFLWT